MLIWINEDSPLKKKNKKKNEDSQMYNVLFKEK